MKMKHLAVILAISLILPITVVVAYVYYPYTWGDKGTLTLTMTLDRTQMRLNETTNATFLLKNEGSESVRLYRPHDDFNIELVDRNGTSQSARIMHPAYMTMNYDYNAAMTTLKPGGTISATLCFGNSYRYAQVKVLANETYQVKGVFSASKVHSSGILPHWAGTALSTQSELSVKP